MGKARSLGNHFAAVLPFNSLLAHSDTSFKQNERFFEEMNLAYLEVCFCVEYLVVTIAAN